MSESHLPARPPAEPVELTDEPIPLGYPDGEATAPRRWNGRTRRFVLGAVLVFGLAATVGVGSAGWRILRQKSTSLATPTSVAGLQRDDSVRARSTADYLRDGLAADIELNRSFGVIYRDPADEKRSVLLFGGTTLLWQPERDLDTLFRLLSDEAGSVTGLHEVPAGDLGGVMKCGRTSGADGFPVCGWADHGSVVLGMFPGREIGDAGGLMRRIRDTIQSR